MKENTNAKKLPLTIEFSTCSEDTEDSMDSTHSAAAAHRRVFLKLIAFSLTQEEIARVVLKIETPARFLGC